MKPKNIGRPKVAVIDDEPDFLLLVESWLKSEYEVTVYSHCDGLVENIGALEPDLVLLDIHMPEESGFTICRRLRSVPRPREPSRGLSHGVEDATRTFSCTSRRAAPVT